MFRTLFSVATAMAVLTPGLVFADEIVLTVRAQNLEGGMQEFDMAAIEALPQERFSTSSVWTEGVHEFSGPSLATVLDSLDVTGVVIHARALNDYAIEIPVETLEAGAPIIATRIDGEAFPRREKGPLWIVYPYDADVRFQTESTYGRSIWQLVELRVE